MSGKCPNCWGPLGATGYYQPPPRSPRAQALQRKIDEQAALLDALLPVALAAVRHVNEGTGIAAEITRLVGAHGASASGEKGDSK